MQRRKNYPKVKKFGGLYSVRKQPRNDPLIQEVKDAVKSMPLNRQFSSGEVTLAESGVTKESTKWKCIATWMTTEALRYCCIIWALYLIGFPFRSKYSSLRMPCFYLAKFARSQTKKWEVKSVKSDDAIELSVRRQVTAGWILGRGTGKWRLYSCGDAGKTPRIYPSITTPTCMNRPLLSNRPDADNFSRGEEKQYFRRHRLRHSWILVLQLFLGVSTRTTNSSYQFRKS